MGNLCVPLPGLPGPLVGRPRQWDAGPSGKLRGGLFRDNLAMSRWEKLVAGPVRKLLFFRT